MGFLKKMDENKTPHGPFTIFELESYTLLFHPQIYQIFRILYSHSSGFKCITFWVSARDPSKGYSTSMFSIIKLLLLTSWKVLKNENIQFSITELPIFQISHFFWYNLLFEPSVNTNIGLHNTTTTQNHTHHHTQTF